MEPIPQPTARVIYLKAFKCIQIYLQQLCGQADANFALQRLWGFAVTGQPLSSLKI